MNTISIILFIIILINISAIEKVDGSETNPNTTI